MPVGTVKFFDEAKGHGFVTPDAIGQADVYVHRSALQWSKIEKLDRGERVHYEVSTNSRAGRDAVHELKIIERTDA